MTQPSRAFGVLAAPLLAVLSFLLVTPAQAQVKYQFNGAKELYFEYRERIELPIGVKGRVGYLMVLVKNIDPVTEQITFQVLGNLRNISFDASVKNPQVGPPANVPLPMLQPGSISVTMVIDPFGKLVLVSNTNGMDHAKDLLHITQMLYPSLSPTNAPGWRNVNDVTFFDPLQKTEVPATVVSTYKLGARDGAIQVINSKVEGESKATAGNQACVGINVDGIHEFDTLAGISRSGQLSATMTFNDGTRKVQCINNIQFRLLSPEEIETIKTPPPVVASDPTNSPVAPKPFPDNLSWERSVGKNPLKPVSEIAPQGVDSVVGPEIPPKPTTKSTLIGPTDTFRSDEYEYIDPSYRPMLGIRVEPESFGRMPSLRSIHPLYEKPDATGPNVTFARDGYVITSVLMHCVESVSAVKVTYTRLVDGKTDPTQTYTTPWLGTTAPNATTTRVGTNGKTVLGLYGKRTQHQVRSLGLILAAEEPAPDAGKVEPPAPPALPWQPVWPNASVTELLSQMNANGSLTTQKTLLLGPGQFVISTQTYKSPLNIRMVIKSDGNDLRLYYAADQVIFNWDMNNNELRIDGGPADNQHRRGSGQLPKDRWSFIEWVVKADEMTLYVNGEERQRVARDFSQINRRIGLRSQGGWVQIKAIEIVK